MSVFKIYEANSLKFVRIKGTLTEYFYDEANEKTRLYHDLEIPYARTIDYQMKLNQGDNLTIQYKTDYVDINHQLIDIDGNITNLNNVVQYIGQDSDGYSIYQVPITTDTLDNIFFVRFTSSDLDKPWAVFQSEYFEVKSEHENCLLLEYFGSDTNGIIWDLNGNVGSKYQHIRFESRFLDKEAASNKTVTTDSANNQQLLRGLVQNVKTWNVYPIPGWLVDRINIALTCEYVYINGIRWQNQDKVEATLISNTTLFEVNVKLTEVGYNDVTVNEELTGDAPTIGSGYILINNTDKVDINTDGDDILKS